jgi:uroporphyrinogen decarboxylase
MVKTGDIATHSRPPADPQQHRQRIQAAIAGEPVRPTPVAFWHHFPADDGEADSFAAATEAFYRRYDVDLVKLMPTGMYSVIDYGVAVRPSGDEIGTTLYASGPVASPGDWARLPDVSPTAGVLGREVAAVQRVRQLVGPDVPVIQTIFSPLTMAAKIAGGDLAGAVLADESVAHAVLSRLAQDVIAFGRACLAAGADGFFFATQLANAQAIDRAAYDRLGVPYDLQILDALRPGAWLQVLHLHGVDPFFELADRYPVDVVNWEDRETKPSLADALAQTGRCLLGGLDRGEPMVRSDPARVAAQVRDAVAQTGGRRLIVGGGCVLPVTAAPENLAAIVSAARSIG